jgi:hypothetical protein
VNFIIAIKLEKIIDGCVIIINPEHFGFKIKWTLKKLYLYLFLTDPFAIHKWIYHNYVWMWQFGGNSEYRMNMNYAPCHLKWEAFKLNN